MSLTSATQAQVTEAEARGRLRQRMTSEVTTEEARQRAEGFVTLQAKESFSLHPTTEQTEMYLTCMNTAHDLPLPPNAHFD
jgi:hypothetical protein